MRIYKDSLCKELCVRCRNEVFGNTSPFRWNKDNEDEWSRGCLFCPFDYIGDDNNEYPPSKCPYRLEHLMATQMEFVQ